MENKQNHQKINFLVSNSIVTNHGKPTQVTPPLANNPLPPSVSQPSWQNELSQVVSHAGDYRYSAFDSLRQSEGDQMNMGWSKDMVKDKKSQG